MASPARFSFDLDLRANQPADRMLPESAVALLVAQARVEGRAEGLAEGERTTGSVAATRLASAANLLADRSAEMLDALDVAREAALREAVDLAAAIARKLAGHLIARHPVAEIEALVADCMSSLDGVPHLVIRCAPDLADAVRDMAMAQMAQAGFTGRLVVMGDPEQKTGDCRIEWVDGGLVRDINAISAAITKRIAAYLAASTAARTRRA